MATDPSHVNPLDCHDVSARCPVKASIYGYYPILACNAFFLALFGLCFILNLIFGWRYRTWTYTLAMSLACLAATIGYLGRVLMHDNPFNNTGFEMQICCLTISPAFNAAAIYLMLKHIVRRFGRTWSWIRPKYYTWGFISADIAALILQAAGGGIAATAGNNTSLRDVGDRLMITGISWQVLTLLVFGIMITDYVLRRRRSPAPLSDEARRTLHDQKFRIFSVTLLIVYTAIFTRCVYRIAEMANGWRNPIMQNQGLFIGIDSRYVPVQC